MWLSQFNTEGSANVLFIHVSAASVAASLASIFFRQHPLQT